MLARFIIITTLAFVVIGTFGCMDTPTKEAVETQGTGTMAQVGSGLKALGSAPASIEITEPMRPYFAAGLAFLVLGGIAIAFGGRGTGALLMAAGIGICAVGVMFVQYPWVTLIIALAEGAMATYLCIQLIRAKLGMKYIVEEIEQNPEGESIKEGVKKRGRKIAAAVRRVVDPIKSAIKGTDE